MVSSFIWPPHASLAKIWRSAEHTSLLSWRDPRRKVYSSETVKTNRFLFFNCSIFSFIMSKANRIYMYMEIPISVLNFSPGCSTFFAWNLFSPHSRFHLHVIWLRITDILWNIAVLISLFYQHRQQQWFITVRRYKVFHWLIEKKWFMKIILISNELFDWKYNWKLFTLPTQSIMYTTDMIISSMNPWILSNLWCTLNIIL